MDYSENSDIYLLHGKKKKRIIGLFISIIIIIIALIVITIYIINMKYEPGDYKRFKLTNWEAVSSEKINKPIQQLCTEQNSNEFIKAPINWTTATAMGILNGDNNTIFFNKNLKNIDKKQFDVPWYFRSKFTINNVDSYETIILHINGINYRGDVYIDGRKVNEEEIIGTFIKYQFNIKKYLKYTDEHYILFKLYRPHNLWGKKYMQDELDLAISFVDWNPEAPDSNLGVWQPVEIELLGKNDIVVSDFYVNTVLTKDDNTEANLNINFIARNFVDKNIKTKFNVTLGNYTNFTTEEYTFSPNEEKLISLNSQIYKNLIIQNPLLWYPHNMGKQILHELTIKSLYQNYTQTQKIGLREVKSTLINIEPNKTKIRKYIINNKNVLIKGAGWTPDLFLRETPERYRIELEYVKDMGLNAIRLEGKFEHKEFYEYCDELGILLIEGFNCADAWQRWELWKENTIELSNKSVKSLIKKLSPHPSVIIFILGSDFPPIDDILIKWLEIFKNNKWPNEILYSATRLNNTGVKMSGPYSWVPPHYFLFDINKERGGAWGFLTEGGPGENPLRYGSIEKVFLQDDIKYPLNKDTWYYHCGNSQTFNTLDHFLIPLNLRYGEVKSFDDFMRKSAASVMENHKSMFEAFSVNKYESTGIIHWMLNNAWPSNIWHLYDYFLTPTPAYFAVKKANEKIHLMYNYYDHYIYLINNVYEEFNINYKVCIEVYDENGEDLKFYDYNYTITSIEPDKKYQIIKLNNTLDNYFINLYLKYEDKITNKNVYWITKEMDEMSYKNNTFYNVNVTKYANLNFLEKLNKVKLKYELNNIIEDEKIGEITVLFINDDKNIAFMIECRLIENESEESITPYQMSDNYFSLFKGEKIEIKIKYDIKNAKNKNGRIEVRGWNVDKFIIDKN